MSCLEHCAELMAGLKTFGNDLNSLISKSGFLAVSRKILKAQDFSVGFCTALFIQEIGVRIGSS